MSKPSRSSPRAALGVAAILGALLAPGSDASADPPDEAGHRLLTPARGLLSAEDASEIALNPGNMAFLPEPELRWTWAYTQSASQQPIRGHAVEFSYPFWFLASGLRVEFIDPPSVAAAPYDDSYAYVRWGSGFRIGEAFGFGTTLGWSISESDSLDGQFGVTSGVTLRPFPFLGVAAVARNWNIPTARDGTRFERSYDMGLAVRPVDGKRMLELGLEASYYETSDTWVPRAVAAVDIPYVGRLRADMALFDATREDPDFLVTGGMDFNFGPTQFGAGAIVGDAIGIETPGFYVTAALRGFIEPGVPLPSRVVRIDIDSTPGVRAHTRLLRKLWRLADDPEVDGVLLAMTDEPAGSLAHAEELGDAIRTLQARKKKVMCHLEDARGRALYVCAQADRIAINPAGGLRFAGISSRYFYFGGTLDKLGVKADFVRIGAHKGAAEQLTTARGTEVAAADHQELVDDFDEVFVHDVGGGRKISRGKLRETIAKGPFVAREALAANLVDALVYPDEIGRFVNESMGREVALVTDVPFRKAPKRWYPDERVAIVYLDGDMVDGESQSIPFLGIKVAGSRTIAGALKRAREDASVKAVIFRIETGGGSSLAADVIHREVFLTSKVKPVIVSMGSAAASGGYYAAVGSRPIFANRATVTGSIGIFYGKVDVTGLLAKLGVATEGFRSSPRADAESFFRPFTPDEREELGRKVKGFYDLFIGRVAEGRGKKPEEIDAVARGKVWSGFRAKEKGLVDRIGGLRHAMEYARRTAHLDRDVAVVELPEEDDSLLGILLKLVGIAQSDVAPNLASFVPLPLIDLARAVAPFTIYRPDVALARADFFEVTDVTPKPGDDLFPEDE